MEEISGDIPSQQDTSTVEKPVFGNPIKPQKPLSQAALDKEAKLDGAHGYLRKQPKIPTATPEEDGNLILINEEILAPIPAQEIDQAPESDQAQTSKLENRRNNYQELTIGEGAHMYSSDSADPKRELIGTVGDHPINVRVIQRIENPNPKMRPSFMVEYDFINKDGEKTTKRFYIDRVGEGFVGMTSPSTKVLLKKRRV